MSAEAPRQPSTTGEIATQGLLQHMGDVLHQRGLGETMVLLGKDGLTHALITPSHPLPTRRIPHPVIHVVVLPSMTRESMLFVEEIEIVDSSVITGELVEGFPPVKKAHPEQRAAIGDGSMQVETLIANLSNHLNPTWEKGEVIQKPPPENLNDYWHG